MSLKQTGLIDQQPSQGDFGLTDARIVAAGYPERSVLLFRLAKSGSGHMPQFGSRVTDVASVRMIRDWIAGLEPITAKPTIELAALKSEKLTDASIAPFFQSQSAALLTALSLDDPAEKISTSSRAQVVQLALAAGNPGIRDLFERFVPEEQRVARLGTSIKPAELLTLKGRAEMGRKVFFELAQCATCHQVKGEGKAVGPDLAIKTVQKTRAEILENILEPSKIIETDYIAQLIETQDGETLTGFMREQTATGLVIRDITGQDVRLKAADVRRITPQKLSLMPEGLLQGLTAQEAADLLQFVVGLGTRQKE
ncbi:MAG: c-type cytochrome [Opitutaceae bacterium]|nr:c-type cytochrome [Verrucomicrobiales bacterium]